MGTNTTTTSSPLRLALIGLGNQGQEHLLGAQDSTETCFVAGVDNNEAQRQSTQQHYPNLQLFSDINALAAQADRLQLDGVVLCLPHQYYITVWEQVVALKLPILKEKPLARTVEEAHQLMEALPSNQLKTAIQRRHHPSYWQLKQLLKQDKATPREIHVWLHLGRENNSTKGDWRSDKKESGGGILLDAGYHLVDLVHYLIGPVEVINCTTWRHQQRCLVGEIEDSAQLLGRNEQCWFMLDAQLGGDVDEQGIPQKSEGIYVQTDEALYFANRTQIKRNDEVIWQGERTWQSAMAKQLDEFAADILDNQWSASTYWDQLPAMRLIEEAYQLSTKL